MEDCFRYAVMTQRILKELSDAKDILILSCLPDWVKNKPMIIQRIYVKLAGFSLGVTRSKDGLTEKFWINKRGKRITKVKIFRLL